MNISSKYDTFIDINSINIATPNTYSKLSSYVHTSLFIHYKLYNIQYTLYNILFLIHRIKQFKTKPNLYTYLYTFNINYL